MNFPSEKINEYCTSISSEPGELLYNLERETHLKTLAPQMLSGHLQGRLLALLSTMIRPKIIVEIGTFTGYGTLCLAEGLTDDGLLYTLESNREVAQIASTYFDNSAFASQIVLICHEALDVLHSWDKGAIDLAFLDGAKSQYASYYDLLIAHIRPGGYIIADNILWSGKVIDPSAHDQDTEAIRAFNLKIKEDDRVEQVALAVRDGLLLIRKKP